VAYRKRGEERGKKEKFKPLSNRALVKREEQRASGINLPDAAKEKP
jgi:co-chaperonin GroES (HSP10)